MPHKKVPKKLQKKVSRKISKLRAEGDPPKQAIAKGISIVRQQEKKRRKKK